MATNFIKHYLLSDEEAAKLSARFGQFIMTESGLIYIDLDENTRIQLGGSGGGAAAKEKELTYAEYEALSEEEKMNGTTYYITDVNGGGGGSGGSEYLPGEGIDISEDNVISVNKDELNLNITSLSEQEIRNILK